MKKYDIVATVGSYEAGGETKKRYQNVGAVIEGDNGPYILLSRTFNPAGVPGQEGRESVLLSLFEPRQEASSKPSAAKVQGASRERPKPAQDENPFDDSIPF